MSQTANSIKPDIQLNIATYEMPEKISPAAVDRLILRIEQHLQILRGMHVEGLLFSFKGIDKIDKLSLAKLIKHFNIFHSKLRAFAGFCDYSPALYKVLLPFVKGSPLGLFRTRDIMSLAVGTCALPTFSTLLVFSDDADDRQAIASTLISNDYFVVLAISRQDFQQKAQQKERFDRIVSHSYFGNMHEDVVVKFEDNIFYYEFKGALNVDISNHLKLNDFKYRLSLGYKIFIFDLARVFHMDLRAAYYILEMDQLAQPYGAKICLVDLNPDAIDTNAKAVMEKSRLWVYDELQDALDDNDLTKLLQVPMSPSEKGISKNLLALAPHVIAANMQSLEVYEIKNPSKSPSKQLTLQQLDLLKPMIVTQVSFHGDYEGELLFLFAQNSTEVLINHILGDLEGFEGEDFLDAMTEFVNSVTGTLKSNLRKNQKCIQFSLPQSTALLSDVAPTTSQQSVVLTNFKCEGYPYYVALTYKIKN